MKLTITPDSSDNLSELLKSNIVAFNKQNWQVERHTLGFRLTTENGEQAGGVSGRCFGNWLLIDWLWVEPAYRGHGHAAKLVSQIEEQARSMGARAVSLDTLDFQARPFYEKLGYRVKYQLDNYPVDGTRYYMEKQL